ncbi:ParB N-terminal domain-containing protein [Gymnodinialimonas sp. 2305UL16-5]|uniref:ParB/RepB/Spo0J family partition protein n=1 Tax=Gymnodinialimonas mytili TaxID=3126503 RepID=UPI0030AB7D79
MVRRRERISAPSADELNRLEEEFRRETPGRGPLPGMAPIAQVAAETASTAPVQSPEDRAKAAQVASDAKRYRQADEGGLLIREIPLDAIEIDLILRDRVQLNHEELSELKASIAESGMRLPIEVVDHGEGAAKRYGLISGYRRLRAVQALAADVGQGTYDHIKALVRAPMETGAAFAAMVEENEVRADLSPFERGRIAVLSAQQGAFASVEAAVDVLFAHASKAKRSKVRSFALVYEELGDMLLFADELSEKRGLQLAQALRNGGETLLREALDTGATVETADQEWALLAAALEQIVVSPGARAKTGRPKKHQPTDWESADVLHTTAGITIRKQRDQKGFILKLEGNLSDDLMQSLMQEISMLLSKP